MNPGSELPRGNHLHDDLFSRGNFIALGQAHRHLITTNLSEFLYFTKIDTENEF